MAKKVLQNVTDFKVFSDREAVKALNWDITDCGTFFLVACDCGGSVDDIEYSGYPLMPEKIRCKKCGKYMVNLFSSYYASIIGQSEMLRYSDFDVEKDKRGLDRYWIATNKKGKLNKIQSNSNCTIPKAAFVQKPLDEGITLDEIKELVSKLECEQVIPLEVQANNSCALGLISLKTAEELDYNYNSLIRNVKSVIKDTNNETEDGYYDFDGFPVYIGY